MKRNIFIFFILHLLINNSTLAQNDSLNISSTQNKLNIKVNVDYPKIAMDKEDKVYKRINQIIKDSVSAYTTKGLINLSSPFILWESNHSEIETLSMLSISHQIIYNTKTYLSIYFIIHSYKAGAVHGYFYYKSLIFKIYDDGFQILQLDDLINDKIVLSNLVYKKLVKEGISQEQADQAYNRDITSALEAYTIDQDGINFYIPPYVFASYAAGDFKIKVLWKELKGISEVSLGTMPK